MMAPGIRSLIEDFLAQKRIAIVGVSRDTKSFSRTIFNEFRRRGYDVIPVNPQAEIIDDIPCVPRVQDISAPVDAALLLIPKESTQAALADCHAAGVQRVWIYGINGAESIGAGSVEFCATHGIELVPGYCPFMFLPETGFIHLFHGRIMKLLRTYPN